MIIDQELTRVIHRDLHADLPIIERGEGIYLFDTDGNPATSMVLAPPRPSPRSVTGSGKWLTRSPPRRRASPVHQTTHFRRKLSRSAPD